MIYSFCLLEISIELSATVYINSIEVFNLIILNLYFAGHV